MPASKQLDLVQDYVQKYDYYHRKLFLMLNNMLIRYGDDCKCSGEEQCRICISDKLCDEIIKDEI